MLKGLGKKIVGTETETSGHVDGKAWVRQWVALMLTVYVITLGIVKAFLVEFDLITYIELTAPAYGFIGWFFTSREVEKTKRR